MATDIIQPSERLPLSPSGPQAEVVKPPRLLSLDGLRGFDMFWIIGGQQLVKSLTKVWPGRFTDAWRSSSSMFPGPACISLI